MVVSARAKSLDGPWENSPYNPVVHTWSRDEKWWSKGHGSLVEGPDGKWYLVYHAYENGFWTLGRQTLLEPVEWTADGWIKSSGYDVAKPIPKPGNAAVPHGMALSDDFRRDKMGLQWAFHEGSEDDAKRYRYDDGTLIVKGKGSSPQDCAPLAFTAATRRTRSTSRPRSTTAPGPASSCFITTSCTRAWDSMRTASSRIATGPIAP